MSDNLPSGEVSNCGAEYSARVLSSWMELAPDWLVIADRCAATPFQSLAFLKSWYSTFAQGLTRQAIIIDVRDASGQPALLLPLIWAQEEGLRVIRFADAGVSDNNAPLLGPAAPLTSTAMMQAWQAVRAALPRHDVMCLEKIPNTIADQVNPLTLLPGLEKGPLNAHPLKLDEEWSQYLRRRSKKFRKEQDRVWRVFQRHEGARFDMITNADEALRLFDDFEREQSDRLRGLGQSYFLDGAEYRAFYRKLFTEGLGAGTVIFGVLRVGDVFVGGLVGFTNRHSITFVRLSHAGGEWRNCSPGRLVIERVLIWAHQAGYRQIDFSIGDYDYKNDFDIDTVTLKELTVVGSWKGLAMTAKARLKGLARRSARLRALRNWLHPALAIGRGDKIGLAA